MDWLATPGAAAITGLLALTGSALHQAAPRELRRARELSVELESMDADSPAARLVAAARDDLVAASVIRTTITPWSLSRAIALALIAASLTLAVLAVVPLVYGIVATANGESDDVAALFTLLLIGSSAALLLIARIPAARSDRQVKDLRMEVRAKWGLPAEFKMNAFSDEVPAPPEPPTTSRRRDRRRNGDSGLRANSTTR
jgi:hypothetical protein